MEPTLAEIRLFAGNFAPRDWALCEGQILAINSNQALFSLLGTTYGGDGRSSFGLPDLRGRFPISQGRGAGLPEYRLGQRAGNETHTLNVSEIPPHTHTLNGSSGIGTNSNPEGLLPAQAKTEVERGQDPKAVDMYGASPTPGVALAADSIQPAGNGQSFTIRNPYLGLNYIIALVGVFPSRS